MRAEKPESGALETLRRGWRGSPELRQGALLTVALAMIIIVLLVRPSGLFGRTIVGRV